MSALDDAELTAAADVELRVPRSGADSAADASAAIWLSWFTDTSGAVLDDAHPLRLLCAGATETPFSGALLTGSQMWWVRADVLDAVLDVRAWRVESTAPATRIERNRRQPDVEVVPARDVV